MSLLRERNFARLFVGQTASWFGDRMVTIAWAFAVLELGGGAGDIGVVLAVWMAATAVSLVIGGVVADRLPRRAVMVASDLLRLASQGLIAALLITDAAEVWMIAVSGAVVGVGSGFFNPASTGLMPLVVGPERLQDANGLRAIGRGAGEIGGPILAGVLVAAVGPGWALGVDALTFALSAACLVALRLPPHVRPEPQSFLRDLSEGWTAFTARTWVWSFVAAAAIGNACWASWSVLGPVIAERDFGGADTWGVIVGVFGAGSLIGGAIALKWRPQRPILVATLTVLVFSSPLAALAAGAPAALVAAAAGVGGVALMVSNTFWESTIQRHIPSETLSRVSAYDWMGSFAAYPIGAAVWGPLSVAIGISASLWLAYAIQCLTALSLVFIREIRQLGPYPRPAA